MLREPNHHSNHFMSCHRPNTQRHTDPGPSLASRVRVRVRVSHSRFFGREIPRARPAARDAFTSKKTHSSRVVDSSSALCSALALERLARNRQKARNTFTLFTLTCVEEAQPMVDLTRWCCLFLLVLDFVVSLPFRESAQAEDLFSLCVRLSFDREFFSLLLGVSRDRVSRNIECPQLLPCMWIPLATER